MQENTLQVCDLVVITFLNLINKRNRKCIFRVDIDIQKSASIINLKQYIYFYIHQHY